MQRLEQNAYRTVPPNLFDPLPSEEKQADGWIRPSASYWQDVWMRFTRNKTALFGLVFIGLMALFAIFGPLFSPYPYDGMDMLSGNQPPNSVHWFGTDKFGRDIFTRVMYGARISLTVGVFAAMINLLIGVVYGSVSGYFGGRVDMVMMRIVDILIGLPSLLYIVLLMLVLGSNLVSVIIALCITSWIGTARVVRGQVLSIKHNEYVLAAMLAGATNRYILFRHLLPNSMGPIIVSTAFLIPSAIFSEAFLSFLGIGINVPMASWGTLANEAIPMLQSRPYQMLFPVAAISLTMFSLNFIGDGLRDSLDPRLKK
ncbi:MAG: ABC transporter permease [Oscillospiraceae bacterium]|jgi:oligopeptide transport system permease protein|nr:ABC transporter permease [Oscillospiraceae bacterium]